jgi:hypothetical protein
MPLYLGRCFSHTSTATVPGFINGQANGAFTFVRQNGIPEPIVGNVFDEALLVREDYFILPRKLPARLAASARTSPICFVALLGSRY